MKITVLGSSHGVPEPNRKCTSFMLEIGENVYFVDMGTNPVDALRKRGMEIDRVKGVFVTHMHGDHTNGLVPFTDLITWYFKTPDPLICLPMPEAAKVLQDWMDVTLNGNQQKLRYREVTPGVIFDDGILKVTAIATQHCKKSFAYLVEAEGKTVLFTGDLKHPAVDFPAPAMERELDLVICEGAHFSPAEYLPVFEKCRMKKVCMTHYQNKFIPGILEVQNAMAEKHIPALMATDDLEILV